MEKYTEVRWHGRAQQGIVTAAKLLGETALTEGKYVQAFPEFGPERMGAPVRSYNRLSDKPIRVHCSVTSPDVVIIVDITLIAVLEADPALPSTTSGTDGDAVFLVNTNHSAERLRGELGVADSVKVYTLDASQISLDTIGRQMPNTPMLGALAKATDLVKIDGLIENFRENYSKKYDEKVIAGNIEAMKRGYAEVKGE
ncbi:Pyruvate:ferredoxin oxidoreductase, gamma subunit [hydrothermal vent metagenome]|uniref:Pyruvate:ferredoxin oxidoreductase, gamma subunit n=1 Tax=hydrothermal vent metagenome TaxID=652676 RepID=A0A3B0V4W7_9ZZZZ